jgi:rod shape-determining protein MreC
VGFVIFSLILMSVDHRQHYADGIRSFLSVLIYPLDYAIGLPGSAGGWLGEALTTRHGLQEENRKLHAEHQLLMAKLQKYQDLEAENNRLHALMDSSQKVSARVMVAELLDVDMEPFSRKLVLNKGSRHGVYAGQPVIDAEGIMGQVIHVGPVTSTVILITDPSHAIPVSVNRNGLRAIAIGSGAPDQLELQYMPNNTDIQAGDLLVSSGLGRRFPAGYPVGKIESVKRDPRMPYAKITARPAARLESGREVLLIWPKEMPPVAAASDCPADQAGCNKLTSDAPPVKH